MSKFLNLIALSSLVGLATQYGPAPVAAVSVDALHGSSNLARGHGAMAKRRRSTNAKRCKKRPDASSSPAPQSTQGSGNNNNNNNPQQSGNNQQAGDFAQLGYAWTMDADLLPDYNQTKPTLIYNWRETGPDTKGFIFMPMVWGEKNVDAFIQATNDKTPQFALGPNEPELDNSSGLSSGMSTDSVVDLYWRALDPLAKKGVKVLTPAVTSGQKGMDWMKDFMSKCEHCQFAGQALHWYDVSSDAAIKHFEDHHNAFGLDIYCTEIAFNNFNGGAQLSKDQAAGEMTKLNNWVKGASFMKVIMYFGFQQDMVNVNEQLKLVNGDSSPNDLGSMVIGQLAV